MSNCARLRALKRVRGHAPRRRIASHFVVLRDQNARVPVKSGVLRLAITGLLTLLELHCERHTRLAQWLQHEHVAQGNENLSIGHLGIAAQRGRVSGRGGDVLVVIGLASTIGCHIGAVNRERRHRFHDRAAQAHQSEIARATITFRDALQHLREHIDLARQAETHDRLLGAVDDSVKAIARIDEALVELGEWFFAAGILK